MADVDGHGEDDGGVVLGSYGVQCLQVSQLKHKSCLQMAIIRSVAVARDRSNFFDKTVLVPLTVNEFLSCASHQKTV
jgi:hypothetical protein